MRTESAPRNPQMSRGVRWLASSTVVAAVLCGCVPESGLIDPSETGVGRSIETVVDREIDTGSDGDDTGRPETILDPVDPPSTPSRADDAERFFELVRAAGADRASDQPVGEVVLSEGETFEETNAAGDRITEFTEQMIRKTVDLSNLVMMDNTIGKVYPGSLLWAAPVRDGRLEPLRGIPGRPAVTTSFTALRDDSGSGVPVIFEHDGSFSGFMAEAVHLFGARAIGGTRLNADFRVSTSLEDALMSIGLSARFWKVRMSAGMAHAESRERSVAIMSLDQVFYSAAVDTPPIGGFLPDSMVRENKLLAAELARGAEQGGEIAYVRKVDYGRRILIALSAEAYSEELQRALSVAVNFIGGGFQGEIDDTTRQLWERVEGKLIIIGGHYPEGVSQFFGGDLTSFIEAIRAITSAEYVNDSSGGVPISFELAYLNDDAPMQVYETTEFAGKIPGRRWGRVRVTERVETNQDHARCYHGDTEMHSDDWTMVELTSQVLSVAEDGRTVTFSVVWRSLEGEANRTISAASNRSRFESMRTFSFPLGRPIRSIDSTTSFAERQEWYAGRVHHFQSFPDYGLLSNVSFRFDGPGSNDTLQQAMQATLAFTVWLEE